MAATKFSKPIDTEIASLINTTAINAVPSNVTSLVELSNIANINRITSFFKLSPSFTDWPSVLENYTFATFINIYYYTYQVFEIKAISNGGHVKCVYGYRAGTTFVWTEG